MSKRANQKSRNKCFVYGMNCVFMLHTNSDFYDKRSNGLTFDSERHPVVMLLAKACYCGTRYTLSDGFECSKLKNGGIKEMKDFV